MKLGANRGLYKKNTSVSSIQWMICWWPKTHVDERNPSSKDKVWFLCSSSKLISQLTCAPSRFYASTAESQVKQSIRRYKL